MERFLKRSRMCLEHGLSKEVPYHTTVPLIILFPVYLQCYHFNIIIPSDSCKDIIDPQRAVLKYKHNFMISSLSPSIKKLSVDMVTNNTVATSPPNTKPCHNQRYCTEVATFELLKFGQISPQQQITKFLQYLCDFCFFKKWAAILPYKNDVSFSVSTIQFSKYIFIFVKQTQHFVQIECPQCNIFFFSVAQLFKYMHIMYHIFFIC